MSVKLDLYLTRRRVLAAVAALGPEGGAIVRRPDHSALEQADLIELGNNYARVTGKGLNALEAARRQR